MNKHSKWFSVSMLAVLLTAGQLAVAGDFSISGDFMGRGELKSNADFNSNAGDATRFTSHRLRAGMNFTPHSSVRVLFQPQYVQTFGLGGNSGTFADGGTLSAHQAMVDWAVSDMASLHVGRFEMNYGNGFLISNEPWNMTGRAFDGVRARLMPFEMGWIDIFAMKTLENTASASNDNNFYGIYSGWDFGTYLSNFDLYILLDRNRATTATTKTNLNIGARLASAYNAVDYNLEAVLQMNKAQTADSLSAVAFSLGFGYTFVPSKKFRIGAGIDYAGKDYQQLYDNIHNYYGIADMITSRKNLMAINLGLGVEVMNDWMVDLGWHLFSRVDAAVANTVGSTTIAAGTAGKALGMEIDLATSYVVNDALSLNAGIGFYLPGGAIKDLTPGDDAATIFSFLSLQTKI